MNSLEFKDSVDKLLDPLEKAQAEKLPTYLPKMEEYPFHNAAEEALMKKSSRQSGALQNFENRLDAKHLAD